MCSFAIKLHVFDEDKNDGPPEHPTNLPTDRQSNIN